MSDKPRLIVASNRLPLSIKQKDGTFEAKPSSGGLVAALSGLKKSTDIIWLGWPGAEIQDGDQEGVSAALAQESAAPIFLDEKLSDDHYNGFANSVLWPVLHYQSDFDFRTELWEAYRRVNQIFAERIADEAVDGDLIWIHDYHLLLLPRLLRNLLDAQSKRCLIGFSLHTPFPAEDFWRGLPVQKDLLDGMLASDIISFHTDEYKVNFIGACAADLEAKIDDAKMIQYKNRQTRVGKYIVGIDYLKFSDTMGDPKVQSRIQELHDQFKGRQVIIGVDRLDYTKGLPEKLNGFKTFLEEHPEMSDKVLLIQIAIPSREDVKAYQELDDQVNKLVGQVNGQFSTPNGSPLLYIHRSVQFEELTALYSLADVCLLTSKRDGMNLVALEYVACQEARHGVLVLSEFAGAAPFMRSGGILFNPSSAEGLANALYKALTMGTEERDRYYERLREFVTTHTSVQWTETFLKDLSEKRQAVE